MFCLVVEFILRAFNMKNHYFPPYYHGTTYYSEMEHVLSDLRLRSHPRSGVLGVDGKDDRALSMITTTNPFSILV